jgi:hypothetical protein
LIQHLNDDELRSRITAKLASGVLSLQSPDETFGGPSAGQRCSACDEAIAATEAEIEVERPDAPPQYFHARCYNLLRQARRGGDQSSIRAAKTTDKTRRGGLPAPVGYSRKPSLGDGSPCDGCGETIQPTEMMFIVSLFDALAWRFHAECCEAWLKFKPE